MVWKSNNMPIGKGRSLHKNVLGTEENYDPTA